jgi:ferric-dicitrate binding protein FerR (iron transport regulator)
MNPNFEAYNLEDFICNESFQRWAKSDGTSEEDQAWNERYASSPQLRETMTQAKLAVLTLSRTESEVDPVTVHKSWEKLSNRIDRPAPPLPKYHRLRYAAVLVVLVLCAVWAITYIGGSEKYITYRSDFGQKKEITLPDGSQITLNANSSLRAYENWDDTNREVWLETGEAFFHVTKTEGKDRFVVHSKDVHVEVLGTKFNINMRTPAIEVMLSEGKVRLSNAKGNQILEPGQLAVVDPSGLMTVRNVHVAHHDAWLRNSLVLDNKSLAAVGALIESQYGISVYLADDVKNKMVAGEIPNGNLELLLKALEVALDLNISKSGDAILITKQSP